LCSPTQLPSHVQWWSKRSTQLSQNEQCLDRGGRNIRQVVQNFCFTVMPLIRRNRWPGSPRTSRWSSISSLGMVSFRGTMPGFTKDARTKEMRMTTARMLCVTPMKVPRTSAPVGSARGRTQWK